jgi:hypothetical protein
MLTVLHTVKRSVLHEPLNINKFVEFQVVGEGYMGGLFRLLSTLLITVKNLDVPRHCGYQVPFFIVVAISYSPRTTSVVALVSRKTYNRAEAASSEENENERLHHDLTVFTSFVCEFVVAKTGWVRPLDHNLLSTLQVHYLLRFRNKRFIYCIFAFSAHSTSIPVICSLYRYFG